MQKLKDYPIAGIASVILGYITFSGIAWHLGYWSTFNFNYLEYANIGDLFKSSIYLLLSDIWIYLVLFTVCAGMVAPMSLYLFNKKPIDPIKPPRYPKIGKGTLGLLLAVSTLAIFAFGGFLARNNRKWDFMPFAFAILFGTMIFMTKLLEDRIKDEVSRLMLFVSIILIPFFCYGAAKKKSIKAKTMFVYKEVIAIKTTDTTLSKSLLRSAYLGGSSHHYFFYLPDRVTVVNADNVESFTLRDRVDDQNLDTYENY